MSASFVETETLQACEQKVARIEGIFKSAGVTIVKAHCGLSEYKFSKFGHTQISQKTPFAYQIYFNDLGVKVASMKLEQCEPELREKSAVSDEDQKLYCVSSSQSLLSQN